LGDRRCGIYSVIGSLIERRRKEKCLIALRWIYGKPGICPAFILYKNLHIRSGAFSPQ